MRTLGISFAGSEIMHVLKLVGIAGLRVDAALKVDGTSGLIKEDASRILLMEGLVSAHSITVGKGNHSLLSVHGSWVNFGDNVNFNLAINKRSINLLLNSVSSLSDSEILGLKSLSIKTNDFSYLSQNLEAVNSQVEESAASRLVVGSEVAWVGWVLGVVKAEEYLLNGILVSSDLIKEDMSRRME